MKLANSGFTAFTRADGLGPDRIEAIFEDRAGNLCVVSGLWNQYISRFDGAGFTTTQPRLIEEGGWGKGQITLQDRTGDWGVAFTGIKASRTRAIAVLSCMVQPSLFSLNNTL